MSDLVTLHAAMVDRLKALEAFRGVVVLSMDDHHYIERLNSALAKLHGAAIAIGNPSGEDAAPDTPGGQFTTIVRVYLFENQELNRDRTVSGQPMPSVADEAARLALTGVSAGQKVFQMDNSTFYWLLLAGMESDAAYWAKLRVATELLENVLRACRHWKPVEHMATIPVGFEPGTLDDLHDFVIRIRLRVGLNSDPLT